MDTDDLTDVSALAIEVGGATFTANSLLHTRPFVKAPGLHRLRRAMSMPLVCCWAFRFGGNAEAVHVSSVCTVFPSKKIPRDDFKVHSCPVEKNLQLTD